MIRYRRAFVYHTSRLLPPPSDKEEGGDKEEGKGENTDGEEEDGDKSDKGEEETTTTSTHDDKENASSKADNDASSTATSKATKPSQVAPAPSSKPPPPRTDSATGLIRFGTGLSKADGNFPMEITRHQFINIKPISMNPLGDRIALAFGFKEGDPYSTISFEEYMQHAADFNRPGNRDLKLKIAFKIQDFDGDEKVRRKEKRKDGDTSVHNVALQP